MQENTSQEQALKIINNLKIFIGREYVKNTTNNCSRFRMASYKLRSNRRLSDLQSVQALDVRRSQLCELFGDGTKK
jgi:hypothetical protein